MECTYRPLRVFLQVVEVRCLVPVCDAVEDAQVKFQRFFHLVENAPDARSTNIPSHFFRLAVAQEVNVQLRPQLLESLGESQAVLA